MSSFLHTVNTFSAEVMSFQTFCVWIFGGFIAMNTGRIAHELKRIADALEREP